MLTVFDILFICAAVIVLFAGILKQRRAWISGRKETLSKDFFKVLQYLIGHKRILRNPLIGIFHLFFFWGFLASLVIIILSQFGIVFPKVLSNVLSLLLDFLGIFMLFGTFYFLVRSKTAKNKDYTRGKILPLIILVLILVTGFLAEGSRLRIFDSGFSTSSPVGWFFSFLTAESPRVMQVMIRIHFFSVLLFIALIPFTFMRHIPAGLQNIYYGKQTRQGELSQISLNRNPIGASKVLDFSQKQLLDVQACVTCGRCEQNCPASVSGKPLSPRKIMKVIFEQSEPIALHSSINADSGSFCLEDDITSDEIWACTTCMACVEHCPVLIDPMDKIIDMRRHLVLDKGMLPKEAIPMIRNLELFGDVQGKGIALRQDWALNYAIPVMSEKLPKQSVLVWIGCSGAFHPRYKEVAKKMVRILTAGGVEYAILGKEEICCGDPARRLGEEALFQDLAQNNIKTLKKYSFDKIIALCPHCFHTLKNEYPTFGGHFNVVSAVEFLLDLIKQNKIVPAYPATQKMTVHDPCYLGRVNAIYEPLRDLMAALPGIELEELNRSRNTGFCCGGGGGRMWLHEELGENINTNRAKEIGQLNVDIVGTACPFCLTMLDDGTKSLPMKSPPKVFDLIEIVASSIGIKN